MKTERKKFKIFKSWEEYFQITIRYTFQQK